MSVSSNVLKRNADGKMQIKRETIPDTSPNRMPSTLAAQQHTRRTFPLEEVRMKGMESDCVSVYFNLDRRSRL